MRLLITIKFYFKILTWQALAVELEPRPLNTLSSIIAPHFFSAVAHRNINLAMFSRESRYAGTDVAVGHVDASSIVETRIGFALVVICLAIISCRSK